MSATLSVPTQQVGIYNALVPKEGPKAVSLALDFTTVQSILIDFTQAYQSTSISIVQSVFVDNSANPSAFSLLVEGTREHLVVPPLSQAVLPIISAVRAKITAVTTSGRIVPVIFLNVPLPQGVWNATSAAVAAPVTGTAGAAHTVTTGGTPVAVFLGGSIPNGAFIINPPDATESLFVDMVFAAGTTAPGSNGTTVELIAGQSFTFPGGLTGSVTANAVTDGHVFTAFKF